MRYLSLVLLSVLFVGCAGGGGGSPVVSDRLRAYDEAGCDNGPPTDAHGLLSGSCSDFSAGQRDLYVDWAHQNLPRPED
jgi:hypothetical protein